jgi:5'-nucleotidase (lipoprotein e(P4) family)
MIRKGITYDQKDWEAWVGESAAEAIPGAKEFLDYAHSRGVTPFYITNRKKQAEEAATRRNLERLGFPLGPDTLLTRTDTRDKSPRRDSVAARYRVLLVLGDDLNDFVFADGKSVEERRQLVENNRARWGTQWLILPNPMYGSWEKALTGDSPECGALQKKIEAVRP